MNNEINEAHAACLVKSYKNRVWYIMRYYFLALFICCCAITQSSFLLTTLVHYGLSTSDYLKLKDWVPGPIKKVILRPIHDLALNLVDPDESDCFVFTKRILLEAFPSAWNPSILRFNDGYLLSFRETPDKDRCWISYVGVVLLDENFEPISEPQLLDTRLEGQILSHAEDARLFVSNEKVYLIYNDDVEGLYPAKRRNMYVAELYYNDRKFKLGTPVMLRHERAYDFQKIQKNWVPFQYHDAFLVGYTVAPHEILLPDLTTGECVPVYRNEWDLKWLWGELRGGTPALLVDGEYLAFFHSTNVRSSNSSVAVACHYYMGAYTFSASPPFEVTSMTTVPLVASGFYTSSDAVKRVIFPGGFVDSDAHLFVAYGKDDRELWVTKIDKKKLRRSLVSVIPASATSG